MQFSPIIEDKVQNILERTRAVFLYSLIVFWILVTILALGTSLYGLISWIMIPRWRKFRNYVFQNIIFSGALHLLTPFALAGLGNCYLCIFFQTVFNHWLVVATAMFYMELVQIFNITEFRYLKANLFAWVLPIAVTLMVIFLKLHGLYFGIATSCFNFLLFLRVCYALIKLNKLNSQRTNVCRLILICGLAFLSTGLIIYLPVLVMTSIDNHQHNDLGVLGYLSVNLVTVTLICVYFLMMRSNKELWVEYRDKRKKDKYVTKSCSSN